MTSVSYSQHQGRIPFNLFVGVTGHRSLPDDPLFRDQVGAALRRVHELRPATAETPVVLTVVSALAEGADRLVARAILAEGGTLEVILPMPPVAYLEDFETDESKREFRALLERAGKVSREHERPQSQEEREEVYATAGRALAKRCDVLVAVWDGQSSRGQGGTAEIVAFARSLEKPLLWIRTEPPFELQEEHTDSELEKEFFDNLREFNRGELPRESFAEALVDASNELLPITPRSSLGLQALRDWIAPHYVRADRLALRYQHRFNWLSDAVYFLAFLATVAAVTQRLFLANHPLTAAPELGFLIAILVIFALERRRRMGAHDRWMVYRFLAERLRSAFFLAAADVQEGYEIDFSGVHFEQASESWLPRALTYVYRQCPRARAQATDVPVLTSLLADAWVHGQIAYHEKAEKRHKSQHNLLSELLYVVFGLTLIAVIVHVAGSWSEESAVAKTLVMAVIALPALGGALSGLRSHRESDRHADRHRRMQALLTHEAEEMRRTTTVREMRKQAIRIEEAMLSENADWLRQIRFSAIPLPGG